MSHGKTFISLRAERRAGRNPRRFLEDAVAAGKAVFAQVSDVALLEGAPGRPAETSLLGVPNYSSPGERVPPEQLQKCPVPRRFSGRVRLSEREVAKILEPQEVAVQWLQPADEPEGSWYRVVHVQADGDKDKEFGVATIGIVREHHCVVAIDDVEVAQGANGQDASGTNCEQDGQVTSGINNEFIGPDGISIPIETLKAMLDPATPQYSKRLATAVALWARCMQRGKEKSPAASYLRASKRQEGWPLVSEVWSADWLKPTPADAESIANVVAWVNKRGARETSQGDSAKSKR